MATLARIRMVVALQDADLFRHCTAEQIVRIAAIAEVDHFATGDTLYAPDEPADALFCIVEGEVEILRATQASSTRDRHGAGSTVGVEEILSDRLRAEHARASQPTIALRLDAGDFFDLLSNNIDIVKALFRRILHEREAVS